MEAGADVNARNSKNGATPAMYAVPGTVAAGDSGCGDQGRLKTMKYIMSVKAFDSNLQGTQDWYEGKTLANLISQFKLNV